jgi:hypothetical protein
LAEFAKEICMKATNVTLLIAMAASSLAAVGCAAEVADSSSGTTDTQRQTYEAPPAHPQQQAYDKEVLALKAAQVPDFDSQLAKLQAKFAILPGKTFDKEQRKNVPQQPRGFGESRQALSSGTAVWTQPYDVKATYYETMSLTAGQELWWSTTAIDANVDPVMVLFQYDQVDNGCSVSSTSVPKLTIKAYNDDYDGAQSRINYTVPATGCYALVIYAYSPAAAGTVGLVKDGCDAPPPLQCDSNGGVPICHQYPPPLCRVTSPGGYDVAVSAAGAAVRGAPGLDFMTANSTSGSADTRLFVFNFSDLTGAENDDTYGSLNSAIDRTDFKFINGWPNAVVLTGYSSGGTATFTGYRR